MEKILVCITAQKNSRRLMDQGAALAAELAGELHILHVQKGNNIFENSDTPRLLESLFAYGCELGGMIHAFAHEDVPAGIGDFVRSLGITKIVLGAVPEGAPQNALEQIFACLPAEVSVTVVARENGV